MEASNVINPCQRCTKGCCKNYLVTITGFDAWLISRSLKLQYFEFITIIPHQDASRTGFFFEPGGSQYDIALDKRSRDENGKGKCVFLIDFDFGHSRCGIYSVRPLVCKTYPAIIENLNLVKRKDVLCASDAWGDDLNSNPDMGYNLLELQFQYDLYDYLIQHWNAQITEKNLILDSTNFLDFLDYFYLDFINYKDEIKSTDWDSFLEQWCLISFQNTNPYFKENANEQISLIIQKSKEINANILNKVRL